MAITYQDDVAKFEGASGIDDVEELLQWLQKHENARADLSACTHLHTAHVQVLMAAHVPVVVWPGDEDLKGWLEPALFHGKELSCAQ